MLTRFWVRQGFKRHSVVWIHPHLVAGFQRGFCELRGALENAGLQSMFSANPEPITAENLGDSS